MSLHADTFRVTSTRELFSRLLVAERTPEAPIRTVTWKQERRPRCCIVCAAEFLPRSNSQRYCGAKCQATAQRERKRVRP